MPSSWFPRVTLQVKKKKKKKVKQARVKYYFWMKSWWCVTSWAGRCAVGRKARSSWCRATVSRSCRRSRPVCDWWSGPWMRASEMQWREESVLGGCINHTRVNSISTTGDDRLPRPRWRRNPTLCWSPEGFPSRPPEEEHNHLHFHLNL